MFDIIPAIPFTTVTETTLHAIRYIATAIEHTLVFHRHNGEQVNLSVQHFANKKELHIVVFDMNDPEQPEIREQVTLSMQGARFLRDLLNRPEVARYLEEEGENSQL